MANLQIGDIGYREELVKIYNAKNGHHLKKTRFRMVAIKLNTVSKHTFPNGHNPKLTQSQINTILNKQLQFYSYLGLVNCLVRIFYRDVVFNKKLFFA